MLVYRSADLIKLPIKELLSNPKVMNMDTEFSHTKEYEVGSGTIDQGRPYEHKMVALVSLRCLLQDFEGVQIAFNAASLGALDDVVINARRKAGDSIKILIQLKHEEKEKTLVDTQFLATKGSYSLLKYSEDILKLKESLDCKATQTGIIKDLNNDDCDAISFLNTNADNANLYKFDLTKVSELSSLPQIDYNFYLFAKQSHVNHLEEVIKSEMEKVLRHFGLTHRGIKNDDIVKMFIEYVTDWSLGKLGGHHYLTKHAILYKLTELLLKQYELDLSCGEFKFYDCPQKELWNEVVNDKRITIIDSDKEVIKFSKLYVGNEIRPYCQKLGKTWSCKFLEKEQNWFYKEYESLEKAMHKVVGRNGKITLLSIYKCLWFKERLPLILKINTVDDYEVILKILKLSEFKLKVIILTSVKLKPTGTELDYFTTLSDLNNEDRLKILNNSVKLQGRSGVTLKELIDDSLFPLINCNAIINILMGNFNIGVAYKPLSEYFIDRSLFKVFIVMDVLKEVRDEIFLINIKEETDYNSVKSTLEEYTRNTNVIIVDQHNPIQILEELKLQNKRIHRLVFDRNNLLEWKESHGSTNSIRHKIITSQLCNELEEFFAHENADNYFNRVNLVSASPGMGKSTLLDYITSIASTETWVLNVNLSDHDDYYDAKQFTKGELTAQDHLRYFNDSNLENHNCSDTQIAESVFQKFLNRRQVLVLLDAMDEVSISCQSKVVKMINSIHKAGFSIWLTTRPHLTTELEEKFSTISTTLRPFSINDQKRFLNKYFKHIGDVSTNQTLIEEFVQKLLQASRNNLNDSDGEFTGIPLQTKLLANAFTNQCKESLASGVIKFEIKFDLLYLFEEFIQSKQKILCDKFGKGGRYMTSLFQEHQALFALKLLFFHRRLFRLDIDNQLKDYNNNENKIQCLQQEGVTIIQRHFFKKTPTFHINFVHRTFAEYFAARWLFNNFNGQCENSKLTARLLLHERYIKFHNYGLLFRMFDCMLAGDSQLHLSIINGRLDQALELIKLNPDITDKCGRSFLHIIPLYSESLVTRKNPLRIEKFYDVTNKMPKFVDHIPAPNIKNTKDILGYTPLDYALLNYSYSVANELCKKSKQLTTSMAKIFDICNENRWYYKTLFKRMLSLRISDEVLSNRLNHDTSIVRYCTELFKHNIEVIEIVNEYTNELGVTTISDLLTKLNIKSADTAQTYYYDLRFAAAFGSIHNAKDLISTKYSIEKHKFDSPLYWAIKYDRLKIVKLLIFYGENINVPCYGDRIPLHCAAELGKIEIVRELLSHQADVNFQSDDGESSLSLAVRSGHIDIAKLLLAHNARVDTKNGVDCFPVYYAAETGLNDLIPDLIKGVDVNHQDKENKLPLLVAVNCRYVNTVRVLLRYGADCNISDRSYKLPIHILAEKGLDEVFPEILRKTVGGVNVRTKEGQTALHLSIYGKGFTHDYRYSNNRANIVNYLLSEGADPNIQDDKGNTALHYLCSDGCPLNSYDRIIVSDLLINKGADVNLKNNNGNTALLKFKHKVTKGT